jgi:hypothetical protein
LLSNCFAFSMNARDLLSAQNHVVIDDWCKSTK